MRGPGRNSGASVQLLTDSRAPVFHAAHSAARHGWGFFLRLLSDRRLGYDKAKQTPPCASMKRPQTGNPRISNGLAPSPSSLGDSYLACLVYLIRFPADHFGLGDFRPPVEAGSAFDGVTLFDEGGASFADDVVEFVDRRDVFVDDRLVDERPQRFGRL